MNKSINILYKVILILIVTQLILSEEQNSSPDIVGTGSFGAATINGKIYNQISFRPEIRYKKLGVGLDINFYIDENGDIYEGNWLLDDSNSIFQTVMDKIYYVRWGNKYDNFYFRVGALESVTLGYGSLVDRYSNAIEYPQIKKLGMDLIYGTDKFKFEFVHSNFKMNPALVGANLKYNMSPRINLLISVAHDSNQLTRLDEIYASRNKESWTETCEETLNVYNPVFTDNEFDEEAHSSTCNEYYDDLESETSYDDENGIPRVDDITGISIGADYVLSERMAFYTEWAHLIGKINAIGTDNQLKEESLGHGIIFPGFIYRFKNGVFQIEARHTLAQNFVFNYWDRSYDIERATQSDDPINPGLGFSTKKQRLYNYGKMHGLYAFVSYDILKIMNFGLGYQDMKGEIWSWEKTKYIDDSNRSFRASLNLNPSLIPKMNKVEFFYQRNNDLHLDISKLFKKEGYQSVHAVHGYDIGVEAAANITIIYQSRTTYRLADGDLEPIRIMQLDTQFYF